MTHTAHRASVRFDIRTIPNISPEGMITDLDQRSIGGLPQVRLPTGHSAVHLTSYSDVHKILTDVSFMRSETNVDDGPSFLPTVMPKDMLLNLDHPDHGRLKRFVAGAYSASTMATLAPSIRHRAEVAANYFADGMLGGSKDLMTDLLDPLTIAVNTDYLGIPSDDIPKFRHLSRQMQLAHDTDIPQLLDDFWELYHYLEDLVSGRRPLNSGLIADLIDARTSVTPAVTDDEYAAILLGSLVGGDQNVLSVLSKIVYTALAEHRLWDLMAANPATVPDVVEELLRLIPLGRISTFPRVASKDVEVDHGTVHVGDVVYADAHEANRDPAVYSDPWVIDTARQGKRHLQFGYGMHHCMGAALARTEIIEAMTVLTSRLPNLRLAIDPEAIEWDTGVLVHRPLGLPVCNHSVFS